MPRPDSEEDTRRQTFLTGLGDFGRLPAEIRVEIWKYAAMENQYQLVDRHKGHEAEGGSRQAIIQPPGHSRAVLSLSRALRHEAEPYFEEKMCLRIGTFSIYCKPELFLLTAMALQGIKQVVIPRHQRKALDLRCLTNLRKVMIGTSLEFTRYAPFETLANLRESNETLALHYIAPWMSNGEYEIQAHKGVTIVFCLHIMRFFMRSSAFIAVDLRKKQMIRIANVDKSNFEATKQAWTAALESNDGQRTL